MEIRIEEHLTGQAYLDRLLGEYGGLEALKAAAKPDKLEAMSDLADVELLMADGARRLLDFKVATISKLEPSDLGRLTPQRLRLLARLSRMGAPARVGVLTAKLGRDKKNVSRDVQVLRALGLVASRREGRETLVQSLGTEIHISLGA